MLVELLDLEHLVHSSSPKNGPSVHVPGSMPSYTLTQDEPTHTKKGETHLQTEQSNTYPEISPHSAFAHVWGAEQPHSTKCEQSVELLDGGRFSELLEPAELLEPELLLLLELLDLDDDDEEELLLEPELLLELDMSSTQ